MELYKYSTTAANNNAAVPDGFPEGWTGAQVNNSMREFAAAVRTHISDGAYVDETYQLASVGTKTLARNSTTQFTVQSCDATGVFTIGRRIRIVGATTDHGYVTSSSFSTHTTVNVTMESGDVPTTPTQALVHVDPKIKSGAYSQQGSGNGLDADKVDGFHAVDIFGPAIHADALVNGSFLIWQRGTSGSAPAGSRTFYADRWFTNPSGAAVTVARTTSTPTGAISPYALKVTGATSVTSVELVGQRVESHLVPYVKATVTFSALIKNETGASLTPVLLINTPSAADDYTSKTNRLTQAFSAISSGASQRVSYTVDISGYTNIDNGFEMTINAASGALNSAAKSITITEVQIDRASAFAHFRFRPFPDELLRCQRYYVKTFDYDTAPAQNWSSGTGSHVGGLIIPGSGAGANPNTGVSWFLPTVMRATPSVTTYNPLSAAATAVEFDGSGTATITVVEGTQVINFQIKGPSQATCFGASASAEL